METNTGSQIPLPRLMGMCVAARLSVGVTVGVSSTCACAGLAVLACTAPLPPPVNRMQAAACARPLGEPQWALVTVTGACPAPRGTSDSGFN